MNGTLDITNKTGKGVRKIFEDLVDDIDKWEQRSFKIDDEIAVKLTANPTLLQPGNCVLTFVDSTDWILCNYLT